LIKISVSTLDAFHKYINDHEKKNQEPIYPDAQSFLDYLTRDFVPSPDMQYGSAIDAIIENPKKFWSDEHKEYIYKGIGIPKAYINRITPFFDYDFPFQVDGSVLYKIGNTEVLLTARVDQLHGNEVVEFKTVWTGYSYHRYADSMQWKCYNVIFDTQRVRYVVADSRRASGGAVTLKKVFQFYQDRSSEHQLEISSLLSQLVDFLEQHNKLEDMRVAV